MYTLTISVLGKDILKYINIRMGFPTKAVNDGSCFFHVLHCDTHIKENCGRYMDEILPYGVNSIQSINQGKFVLQLEWQ